ncbi:MAG: 50S ribosomal protein L16 [Candidatus Njordarchaeia archaeon]
MPTKRPARCYRVAPKKPYTRLEYIKSKPQPRLRIMEIGKPSTEFEYVVLLISNERGQILDRALEASRISVNRRLTKKLGRGGFFFRIRPYPHNVIRETKFLGFAGADRIQQGMRRAFGKPVDRGAIVKPNQILMEIWVREKDIPIAKEAFGLIRSKLPVKTRMEIKTLKEMYPKMFTK